MNASAWDPALVVRPLRRREYDRLVAEGLFDAEPVELLEGVLVEMGPEGAEHAWVQQRLGGHLARRLPEGLALRVGNPLAASDLSEPEPDLAVVAEADYRHDHPAAAVLLIEVSRTSRAKDLGPKARVYAAAGVPSYWVLDLEAEMIHAHTGPGPDGYAHVTRHPFTDTLDAAGVPVRLADLLEPPP